MTITTSSIPLRQLPEPIHCRCMRTQCVNDNLDAFLDMETLDTDGDGIEQRRH